MYNYQTFLKQNKLRKKYQQIRKQFYEDINQKQKINPALIQSHKKRIEGFILAMVEKPQKVNIYQDTHYQPRNTQKAQQIHKKSFYLNHHSDSDRIKKQIISTNSVYDSVPFNSTYSHRFRDFNDESTLKPMRYTSINGTLRVKEKLDSSILNYLPNVNNKKIDKLIKNPNITWKDKRVVKKLNRSLLPSMHHKTYFQSLKTVFVQAPNGFISPTNGKQKYQKDILNTKADQYDDEPEISTRKQIKNSGESMNRKQNSKEALIKCGLLGGKNTAYVIGMENSMKKTFHATNKNPLVLRS